MSDTYISVGGRVHGPYSQDVLRTWHLQDEVLPPETLVWSGRTRTWVPIHTFFGGRIPSTTARRPGAAPGIAQVSGQKQPFGRSPAILVSALLGVLLMLLVGIESLPSRAPSGKAYLVMTDCMIKTIDYSDDNQAAVLAKSDALNRCALSKLGANSGWGCDAGGCSRDGRGFTWLRVFSAIEAPSAQSPANEPLELDVHLIMTDCMIDTIDSSGDSHAAAISNTEVLNRCALSQLGANSGWGCDANGCSRDGRGFTWLRVLSEIENPTGQLPADDSAEDDYVLWCQQALGLGEDECRSIWQST